MAITLWVWLKFANCCHTNERVGRGWDTRCTQLVTCDATLASKHGIFWFENELETQDGTDCGPTYKHQTNCQYKSMG